MVAGTRVGILPHEWAEINRIVAGRRKKCQPCLKEKWHDPDCSFCGQTAIAVKFLAELNSGKIQELPIPDSD